MSHDVDGPDADTEERTRNQANDKAPKNDAADVASGYSSLARQAVTIPHDPAMVDGILRYGALHKNTQRAWIAAAAAVARGL